MVNELDDKQLDRIMLDVENVLKAAETNPNGPGELARDNANLGFIAELAMWANRTGGLKSSSDFILKMSSISRTAWETDYLRKQRQFSRQDRPESWEHWQEKVSRAIQDAEHATRLQKKAEEGADGPATCVPMPARLATVA